MWVVKFTKNAEKDKKLLKSAGLEEKVKKLLNLIAQNPFQNPPSYEKLVGDLQGYYSRRINLQHRLVYKVHEDINTVVVHSMWSHYGDNQRRSGDRSFLFLTARHVVVEVDVAKLDNWQRVILRELILTKAGKWVWPIT